MINLNSFSIFVFIILFFNTKNISFVIIKVEKRNISFIFFEMHFIMIIIFLRFKIWAQVWASWNWTRRCANSRWAPNWTSWRRANSAENWRILKRRTYVTRTATMSILNQTVSKKKFAENNSLPESRPLKSKFLNSTRSMNETPEMFSNNWIVSKKTLAATWN